MSEPIFDAIAHDAERGRDAFAGYLPRHRYHDPDATPAPATEAPIMSLASIVAAAETDAKAIDGLVHNFLTDHLPQLGQLADSVENSELFKAVLPLIGALDPAIEAGAVTVLRALAPVVQVSAPGVQPEPAPAA